MKRIFTHKAIIALVITFTASLSLFAQDRNMSGPPPIPNESQINLMVERLSKALSLTEDQKSQVLNLHINHFKELKEKMEKGKETMDKNRKEMNLFRKEFEESIKSVLDDKQKEKFIEIAGNRNPMSHKMNKPLN